MFVVLAEPLRSASELIRERAAERGVPCGVEVCKTLRVVLEVGPEVLSDGHAAGPGLRFREMPVFPLQIPFSRLFR